LKRPWLAPLVPLYAAGVALRGLRLRLGWERVQRLAWPVVSVGNLSAGGTGKTPFTIALAKLLVSEGFDVDVLSRGFGRTGFDSAEVIPTGSAEDYGDEPLLIAREGDLRVYVAARRRDAGWLAEMVAEEQGRGKGLHLLDDGFQHRQLSRDVDIVLVSSEDLRDWLLPAGNLREPIGALRRATVFAIPAGDGAAVERLRQLGLQQPVWRFRRMMEIPEVRGSVVAFCGIARPGQFFEGLERAGVAIAARRVFRDHHRFDLRDVEQLRRLVHESGADGLITTTKDRVRLGALGVELEKATNLYTAGLQIVLEDEGAIAAWLKTTLRIVPRIAHGADLPPGSG
jgi:tetraacyldisaccharide 4'-kinase